MNEVFSGNLHDSFIRRRDTLAPRGTLTMFQSFLRIFLTALVVSGMSAAFAWQLRAILE